MLLLASWTSRAYKRLMRMRMASDGFLWCRNFDMISWSSSSSSSNRHLSLVTHTNILVAKSLAASRRPLMVCEYEKRRSSHGQVFVFLLGLLSLSCVPISRRNKPLISHIYDQKRNATVDPLSEEVLKNEASRWTHHYKKTKTDVSPSRKCDLMLTRLWKV